MWVGEFLGWGKKKRKKRVRSDGPQRKGIRESPEGGAANKKSQAKRSVFGEQWSQLNWEA